jgi:diguanylate cyclase
MKYHQSQKEAQQLLQNAVDKLQEHGLPCSPINYAVLYQHFANMNSSLSKQLLQTAEENGWDSYLLEFIYEQFIKEPSQFKGENIRKLGKTVDSLGVASEQVQDSVSSLDLKLESAAQNEGVCGELINIIQVAADQIKADQQALASCVLKAQEQTQEIQAELEQARLEALTDSLTGLQNRKGLTLFFEACMSDQTQAPLSALVIDIDHFKSFNDRFGHLIGDLILRRLARSLAGVTEELGEVFRFGGEEFVVLLPECDQPTAVTLAESIRSHVSKVRFRNTRTNEELPRITVSVGVALRGQNDSLTSILERADEALYLAKESGRNQVKVK